MAQLYIGDTNFGGCFHLNVAAPIDDRFVVETFNDLVNNYLNGEVSYYTGMTVYVVDEKQIYVLTASASELEDLSIADEPETELKKYWIKISSGSSSNGHPIVSSIDRLTDNSIDSLVKGSVVYVNNVSDTLNNGLYILIGDDGTDISNWMRNSGAVTIQKTNEVVRDYISSGNTISSDKFYTSQGLNTYEDDETAGEDYITLSNGGSSYIKLYNGSNDKWIVMNLVDDSLGFSIDDVSIIGSNGKVAGYLNGTELSKGTLVKFGKDIDFTGFVETRPDGTTYTFGVDGSNYEDVDIYTEKDIVNVTVYDGSKSAKVLTDVDKDEIEDKISEVENKIENIYTTLLIDPDGDGSDSPSTLQEVIISMNSAIDKLENIKYATNSDIDNIDSSDFDGEGIIQVKTLKYFRDRLPYKVVDSKPIVEIGDEDKELATKEYVDDLLTWKEDLE